MTSFHACSLDEYNPTMVEADETLSTFEDGKVCNLIAIRLYGIYV